MTDPDPEIIRSPLSRSFTSHGITVIVDIYRVETSEVWALEVVDQHWNSIVWEELFPTDEAALNEFLNAVSEIGLARLLEPDDDENPHMMTIH